MDTSAAKSSPKRRHTAQELQAELDGVRHELRLIDHFMATDPKPSEEDQELYRERMHFLVVALRDLPAAITWAKRNEKQMKSNFVSSQVFND